MADTAPSVLDRNHFALRRLHSLAGIVPVGLFLINHMLANSTAFLGQQHFNHHIQLIHSLPWLVWIEVIFIFLPLAFHGLYGLLIAFQGRMNQFSYPYMNNWRYTLQRVTAYITIVFVVVHLVHYRFADWFGIAAPYADAHNDFYTFTVQSFQGGLMGLPIAAWVVIYLIGLAAAIFHFCNGIVTFCITWGIIIGDASRRRLSYAAAVLGVLLLVWGVLSVYALGTAKLTDRADSPPAPATHAAAADPSVAPRIF